MSNPNALSIRYSGDRASDRLDLIREQRLSDKIAAGISPNILNAQTGITLIKKRDLKSLYHPKKIHEACRSYFNIDQVTDKNIDH